MKTGKGNAKTTRSDILRLARGMDEKVGKASARAIWKSLGGDVIGEFVFPDIVHAEELKSMDRDDRLIKTAQWLRDAGHLDDDSAFCMIHFGIFGKYWNRRQNDAVSQKLVQKAREIEKTKYGYDAEADDVDPWEDEEMPPDLAEIWGQVADRDDEIADKTCREFGGNFMADLCLKDNDEYRRRLARGMKNLGIDK